MKHMHADKINEQFLPFALAPKHSKACKKHVHAWNRMPELELRACKVDVKVKWSACVRSTIKPLVCSSALCKCSECECAGDSFTDVRFFDPVTANANQIAFANSPSEIWCTRAGKPLFQLRDAPLLCKKADTAAAAGRSEIQKKSVSTRQSAIIYCVCALSRLRASAAEKMCHCKTQRAGES
jgi:hypothetical protein